MIWENASNPWSILRTAGTSTEAALVSSRLVNFAIGLDHIGE